MLMTKGLDSKILYSILIVSGFVLTIGAASAVVMYSENIELDNGTGDSSIKITSSTGNSKIILEDQGKRTWSISTKDGKRWLQIVDENSGRAFVSIKPNGKVGIGTQGATEKLDVNGNVRIRMNANVAGNLNVDGIITGSYITALEATIADLEARLAILEALVPATLPQTISDHGTMLTSHDTMILSNQADIATNQDDIATNTAAIEQGGGGPGNCNANGDSQITAQEVDDFIFETFGFQVGVSNIQSMINSAEAVVAGPSTNGILDTTTEVAQFNVSFMIPNFDLSCAL